MYKRGDKELILDMFLSCQRILEYTEGLSFEEFANDSKTLDAVVRNIEILGEAVKNVSKEFMKKYPGIEWREIARTRDKLIHFYFGVDIDIIWRIVSSDIPSLFENLKAIIKKEGWKDELET